MQIAIYGKGGIGKSTISANLSAALTQSGRRVLQIGCDPKHDSTRLLHHGQYVQTVLEYLMHTPADAQKLEDVLMEGYGGTGCVEAGGPRPGMGCAGRGILTAFDFLNQFNAFSGYDDILYDVLGDVVCGGFAVPVRKQYANAVFLVTSGESMAIYAANNILQGIRNLSQEERRIAGIICNSRGTEDEAQRVSEFARAVGLPVCAWLPRSASFANAEKEAVTLVEKDCEGREAGVFLTLARQIIRGPELYPARPLSEEQMEYFMRGGQVHSFPSRQEQAGAQAAVLMQKEALASPAVLPKRALSTPFNRVPLFGCAFNGAVALAIHIKDAAVLAHAPKSCVWFSQNGFTGYSRRGFFDRGVLYPAFIPQNFEATDITVQDAIFGGVEHAQQKALDLAERGTKTIIAVTSCIPGMSGDDLSPLKSELAALGCTLYIVHTDGVEAGDYNEGMALCYKTIARAVVRTDVVPDPDSINLVYEQTWSAQTDQNYMAIAAILDELEIRINCRFICATTIEEIRHFLRAPYSVMARMDTLGQEIKRVFEQTYNCKFLEGTFPKGFQATADWVELLGRLYGREAAASAMIQKHRRTYLEALDEVKSCFCGKKALIFLNTPDHDWLFELAGDLELNVVQTMIAANEAGKKTGWGRRFSAAWGADRKSLEQAIAETAPDIVLLNDASALADVPASVCVINITRNLGVGFLAGADCAREWVKLLHNRIEGRWKCDKSLFEKYYC